MLRSLKDMEQYSIGAADGIVGQVKDFYFDDEAWVIRYLVVETDSTQSHRKVLISPITIGQPDWSEKVFPVSLTQTQVRNSPDIDTDKPVSRQHEMGYLGYYGYQNYWGGGGLWGGGLYPDMLQGGLADGAAIAKNKTQHKAGTTASAVHQKRGDPHLRSGNEVMRYYVHATDGDIGHVQGILVDEKTWAIRYIIVNTSNWWLGHEILIAPQWIEDFYWAESKLNVAMTRQALKDAPIYDSTTALNRDQEISIFHHYGREGYWPREEKYSSATRAGGL
jgi:hypothetical protein